jgi:oligoendopeptidase F
MSTTPATQDAGSFVPADLDATKWSSLEPLYRALLERELKCAGCLEQLLLDRSDLDAAASEARTNLFIRMTCHTDDPQTKAAYLDFVEHVDPELRQVSFDLDRKIAGSPHAADLDRERHGVLLRDLKADVEIFRPENIPLQTEDTKLDQQYDETCGAMTVEFQDEERTLPQMAKFLEETDRVLREAAWRAIWERRQRDEERLHEIFERMVELRAQIARNAGYDSFRDYMFKARHRFDYSPADCVAFHDAVAEVCVPLMRRLNAERAEALRVDPLRSWDLAVDVQGRPPLRPFQDGEELVDRTARLFRCLDPELHTLFGTLRGGGCLDLESRKGKAPGGYQAHRDRSKQPFIFMNAVGLHGDLDTMIHEAGHAFHAILCDGEPLLHYRHPPIEFAEVASMSMELLAFPHLGVFYDEADAARAKRQRLEEIATLLPWIATIDAFQHWIYEHPGHDRDERTAQWRQLRERFGPDVSWEGLEHYLDISWQRQGHLYGVPFYYIEYGIAQLGALQLWLISRDDPARALASYKRALSLGGSRPLPELFAAAELQFDFGPTTMRRLVDEVQDELSRLPA